MYEMFVIFCQRKYRLRSSRFSKNAEHYFVKLISKSVLVVGYSRAFRNSVHVSITLRIFALEFHKIARNEKQQVGFAGDFMLRKCSLIFYRTEERIYR